jgi:cytochrome bd ubiquinol oxidase subunit II
MGTVIGAIATGQVRADASQASLAAWTNATSLLTGFMFVGACGYLAAVYLTGEAARSGDAVLKAYFTRRAQAAGIATGVLSLAALAELHSSDAALFSRLTGRALPLVIVAGLSGIAVVALLAAGQRTSGRVMVAVRVIAALGVAAVVWGWGVAQYPVLLPGTAVTLSNAGAPHTTMVALVSLFIVVVLVIGPSFALLFSLHGRRLLHAGDAGALSAAAAAGTQPPAGASRQQPGRQHPAVTRNTVLGLVAVAALVRAALRRRRAR